MEVRIINKYKKILFLLALIFLFSLVTACSGHDVEEVRKELKEYLYDKYGEEFVIDRIGTRDDGRETEYVARIYPEAIVGTKKEDDKYYYGRATIDKALFGGLTGAGDNYSYIMMNQTGEEYLMPKVQEIFGDRVLLKMDSKIEIWGRERIIVEEYRKRGAPNSEGVDAFIGYKESNFKRAHNRVLQAPQHNKLFLELYIYIFDRIDDREEKDKRRKDIFEFVQYLKEEGLFKYLELGVIFIDERVLAPSYDKYQNKVFYSEKVEKVIEGEKVRLPPLELRKEMSQELEEEIDDMSKKELLINMKEIRKDELKIFNKEDLGYYNGQYMDWIMSIEMMKSERKSLYRRKKDNNLLYKYDYKSIDDINLSNNNKYIYLK